MVALSGQPARGRGTLTATPPPAATSTDSTMPRSVIGRRISGSLTVASAALICSRSGEVMRSSVRAAVATPAGRSAVLVVVVLATPLVLQVLQQRAQLGADV